MDKAVPIISSLVIFDQLTKYFFRAGNVVDLGFLQLHFVKNTGTLWGLFQGVNWFFMTFSIIVLIGMFYWRKKFVGKVESWVWPLIVSGAIGNLLDRIFVGFVTDFIDFGWWPAFNVADSCISIAIVLLILNEFKVFSK